MDSNPEISHFDPGIDSEQSLQNAVEIAYKTNREFFGEDQKVEVNILYTREEMDQIMRRKSDKWVTGNTFGGKVNIFSPRVFNEVSGHPSEHFLPVLTHEIAHLFLWRKYKNEFPKWFNEGLATQVAGQWSIYRITKEQVRNFSALHTPDEWSNKPAYPQASLFTHYLFERFGKDELLEFYKSLKRNNSFVEFKEEFAKKFGTSFDICQKEWVSKLEDQK